MMKELGSRALCAREGRNASWSSQEWTLEGEKEPGLELFNELCSKGLLKKDSLQNISKLEL